MNESAKNRVDKALIEYYSMGDPSMSDEEFDVLFEKVYPGREPFEVYSKIFVGRGRRRNLKKPMLSLAKANNFQNLTSWVNSMKSRGYKYVTIAPKYDGAACLIETDSEGEISNAVTRGDGSVGQDITYVVSKIPHDNKFDSNALIQVEITLQNDKMEEANKLSLSQGGQGYSSPRNVAAGLLRKTGPAAKDGAQFLSIHPHFSVSEYGFAINVDEVNVEEIINKMNTFHEETLSKLNISTDGVVLYVSDENSTPITDLGSGEKTPKWSIAWKFPDDSVDAILDRVEWGQNRTKNTPVAIFANPVMIENSRVSRASLHNIDFIREMDIAIGDTLKVVLANKIIPKIVGVDKADESKRTQIIEPEEFKSPLSKNSLSVHDSFAKNILGSLDIDFSGDKTRRELTKYSLSAYPDEIHPVVTIFKGIRDMTDNDILLTIPSFTTKGNEGKDIKPRVKSNILKFSDSIAEALNENRSKVLPQQVLCSISIPTIGMRNSKKILSEQSIKEFIDNCNNKSLPDIEGVGTVGKSNMYERSNVISTIFNEFFPWMVVDSKQDAVNTQDMKKVVITGKFDMPRKDIEKLLLGKGYELSSSVSKDTEMVITPDKDSSSQKITKAKKIGVNIVETDDIEKYIDSL